MLISCTGASSAASDASPDRRDDVGVDRPADAPVLNDDAGDPGGRIQDYASECGITLYCPMPRCFKFEAFCRAQPCGVFTTYDCPIDCEIAVDCDGAEVCRNFVGGDPNCGG